MHFLIKSNNLYYNVSESSYNQTTLMYNGVPDEGYDISNLLLTSTLILENLFKEITLGTETFRPIDKFNKFSIISDANINLYLHGIKTNNELIVTKDDIYLDNSLLSFIHEFNITSSGSNKIVFSFDSGVSWHSYSNGIINLSNTVPLKNYAELSTEEIQQRKDFLNEINSIGINMNDFKNINFNVFTFDKIRLVFTINKQNYNDISNVEKITLLYDEGAHLARVKNSEITVKRYPHTVQYIPSFNTTYLEARVFTHENFENYDEDNRIVLDAPALSSSLNDMTCTLEWNSINNADYYNVYLNGVIIYHGNNLSYTYTIPKRGIYIFAVRAYSNNISEYRQSIFSNSYAYNLYGYLSDAVNRLVAIKKNGTMYSYLSKK